MLGLCLGLVGCKKSNGNPAQPNKETKGSNVTKGSPPGVTYNVVPASKVKWEKLNPKRGDKSPKAATLWGDRKGPVPTGFLVKFVDGFQSPPHIHNVTYRGVVIHGLVHNDDPKAANMWMPTGSFWTQPKGEVHITSAKGSTNVAFIEIENGPYLVLPIKKAFDSGERPVNVDPSNFVWLNSTNTSWLSVQGPSVAHLWGKPQSRHLNGSLLSLPAGFRGVLRSQASLLRSVVIQGKLKYQAGEKASALVLEPGSYFRSKGNGALHRMTCQGKQACLVYVRAKGTYRISSTSSKN
ncbi:MAG: DUF4437 domain-containing protein [Deltaproteobacteria bacterium]|nr:MAG: DUF4437 domain-containing protein [Deltaproteobacteria bacterium]